MNHVEYLSLGGTAPEAYFNANLHSYSALIDYYTFDRIDYTDAQMSAKADLCLMELINLGNKYETKITAAGKKSESVGSHRVEYNVASIEDLERDKEVEEYRIVRKYFALTGLMYRGV